MEQSHSATQDYFFSYQKIMSLKPWSLHAPHQIQFLSTSIVSTWDDKTPKQQEMTTSDIKSSSQQMDNKT